MRGKSDDGARWHVKRNVKLVLGLLINVGGMLAVAQNLLS